MPSVVGQDGAPEPVRPECTFQRNGAVPGSTFIPFSTAMHYTPLELTPDSAEA